MKTYQKVWSGIAALVFVFSLWSPAQVRAATTPSLGMAASYGILANTYTNTLPGTTVSGDIGFTTGPAVVPGGVHANYGAGAPYATAGTDQGNALAALNAQPCTFTFAPGAINLSTDITHGPVGVYTPGVYCSTGAMDVGGPLTLSGTGTFIFRPVGALTSTAGAVVTLAGASSCDVFWTPSAATTLAANTTFVGTIISNAGVTMGANTTLNGRSLAFGGTVTTDTNTITVPSCPVPVVPPQGGSGALTGTINVVKLVINDNGGTGEAEDFPLFLNATQIVSGATTQLPANSSRYQVTETGNAGYTQSFSGDCDADGVMYLHAAEHLFCVLTNDDIGAPVVVPPVPPLIDVVKVPDPLALPDGPGSVMYTYTLRNMGTVPVTDVTMVGDTCSPIVLVSGDVDGDNQLDVTETWVHTCSTVLTATHTNNVVATGWANGLSTADFASATVVVGIPVVPPLIHVTKVPSSLALFAGGGNVTYTERITNPGIVALNNVTLTDDTCAPMVRISGDADGDTQLDPSETWTYTCTANVTSTTTNTATATGEANGFTVRDYAVAAVVVATAIPSLPNTGVAPPTPLFTGIAFSVGGLTLLSAFFILRRQFVR